MGQSSPSGIDIFHSIDELSDFFSDLDIEIATAGKSVAFRKRVQKLDVYTSFGNQELLVESALQEAMGLLAIAPGVWARLSQLEKAKNMEEKAE